MFIKLLFLSLFGVVISNTLNVNNYVGHYFQMYDSPINVIFQGY